MKRGHHVRAPVLLSWCPETNRGSFFLRSAREQRRRYEPRLIICEQMGDGGGGRTDG